MSVVATHQLDEVAPLLAVIEERVNGEHLHAAGFISYDAAPAFDRALAARRGSRAPLLWFGLFREPVVIAVPELLAPSAPLDWTSDTSRAAFDEAIRRIKVHIVDGDTYQVNYTFRLRADIERDPWDLFRELVHAQDAAYAAFIDTGDLSICSVSPELFFALDGVTVTSRPMKGTAPRGRSADEDRAQAQWLSTSEKNRSENVMIVDMIRNDIGRVAEVGTVGVSDLFHVERYPTLWQMTSTVTGQTRASVADIMTALFPCASITGAPKARTTGIIAELETTPRGVYTGAIGFIAPGRRAQFNVAIRTVVVDTTTGTAEYGVGGGVTWESEAGDEYDECLTKARVLTERRPEFELLETIRWTRTGGYHFLDAHLDRMRASAEYFGSAVSDTQYRTLLGRSDGGFTADDMIVRLLIDRHGAARVEFTPFVARREPIRLVLAASPVDSSDVFLFHKTTNRTVYDRARIEQPGADDVVLWNERGEVTETCIANIVVDINGALVTPPVSCGLLPGIGRGALVASGEVRERVISVDELARATQIWVVNSVRGRQRATLVGAPS